MRLPHALLPILLGAYAISACSDSRVSRLEGDLSRAKSDGADERVQVDKLAQAVKEEKENSDKILAADKTEITLLSQQLAMALKAKSDVEAQLQQQQQAKLLTVGARPAADATSTVVQKDSLPLPIVQGLNTLVSATDTGVNMGDFAKLVIALKTSIATYTTGDLSETKVQALASITKDYDSALMVWKRSEPRGPAEIESLLIRGDTNRDLESHFGEWDDLKVPFDDSDKSTTPSRFYKMTDLLDKYWERAKSKTSSLLHNDTK